MCGVRGKGIVQKRIEAVEIIIIVIVVCHTNYDGMSLHVELVYQQLKILKIKPSGFYHDDMETLQVRCRSA